MKVKHNKKRNTAFVYEALVREVTVAIIKNDIETKNKATAIIKKHFKPNSVLNKHLECYRSLYESAGTDRRTSERIVNEAKMANRVLDTQGLFAQQTDLIDDVNKELSPQVFNNFVPNYKTLATIYQIFSGGRNPKESVILENQIINNMSKDKENTEQMQHVDSIVLNSFVDKFNVKYNKSLNENQKRLLNYYISSFVDNSLTLKMFLNEELFRLKSSIESSYSSKEFIEDEEMKQKAEKVFEMLEGFKTENVNDELLIKVLKIQELVEELQKDANND
tara:strand:- start:796 stop:1629 length:834 start_codon:yes stop_codon:yes gene_type:complete